MSNPEDEAITTLRQGDIAGLEALVRLHQLPAMRVAYGITASRQIAEDVVADAFLKVYDHIAQLDPRRPFAPWFYRIVVNGALKALRKRGREAPGDDTLFLEDLADTSPGPEDQSEVRELRMLLLAAIYTLPAEQRAALVLRYYLDMDEATIANTLRCPLGTVKWRLHAARKRLRQSLAPQLNLSALDYEA